MLTSRRNLALACALSGLGGYVDGVGFLQLGGLFVSFMSGNSTRLGVSMAEGHWSNVAEAIGLILLFVVGAGIGGLIVHGQRRYRQALVLFAEAVLLAAAGLAYVVGVPQLAVVGMVMAMGLENAVFQADGGPGIGLTYMTGALVKVGQLGAAALTGGPRWGWLPNLLLWAALVAGAALGAFAFSQINLASVWFAAGAALSLAAIVAASVSRAQP